MSATGDLVPFRKPIGPLYLPQFELLPGRFQRQDTPRSYVSVRHLWLLRRDLLTRHHYVRRMEQRRFETSPRIMVYYPSPADTGSGKVIFYPDLKFQPPPRLFAGSREGPPSHRPSVWLLPPL